MDSMRSLNTSLPTSSPKRRRRGRDPPEQLLQAFRSAALSVTTLYKTAAADQERAHQAGYQAALDDILAFLDQENLGLDDGEGWRVRQWATERLDGAQTSGESEDERGDTDARARSSSPAAAPPHQDPQAARQSARSASPVRSHATATSAAPHRHQSVSVPATESFTFRSLPSYPSQRDTDMAGDADAPSIRLAQSVGPSNASASPHKVDGPSRPLRHRHGASGGRMATRSSTSFGVLGSGAGQKRRLPYSEFFDIGFPNAGKDSPSGGGKRGRFA